MKKFLPSACLVLVSCVPSANCEELLKMDSGSARVGIDRSMGASITYLSFPGYPENMVNIHDPGRLIQQSYYAGKRLDRRKDGQSESWSPWSWNPIQGGGVGESWAKVTEFKRIGDNTLFGETIPKLWDMRDEDATAIMRQWTSFEPEMPDVVVVRNQLVCEREPGDLWGPAHNSPQEVPALYFTRNFDHFKTYLGDGKWREETQAPGPPWGRAQPPLKAMGCFNKEGMGVAVYSPTSGENWNFGPHVAAMSDDPKGGPCVHMAPVSRVHLGPQSTYEYRYWLVVGDEKRIGARLDQLIKRYSLERGKLKNPNPPNP